MITYHKKVWNTDLVVEVSLTWSGANEDGGQVLPSVKSAKWSILLVQSQTGAKDFSAFPFQQWAKALPQQDQLLYVFMA